MNKKFVLTINIGNDAMHNSRHVADALCNVVASLTEFSRIEGDSGRIQDVNGNTVGEWYFTEED